MAGAKKTNVGGVVIPFTGKWAGEPPNEIKPKACSDCEHCYFGVRGMYCGQFAEPIVFDSVAEECSEFNAV